MGTLKKIGIVPGAIILVDMLLLIVAHFTHDDSACNHCRAVNQTVTPGVTLVPGKVRPLLTNG